MAPGTWARLVCEWPDLVLGDVVHVLKHDPVEGYLVRSNHHLEELWLPAHVLSNYNRKPWSFRFRKASFTTRQTVDPEVSCPEFVEKIRNTSTQVGSKVVFRCHFRNTGGNTKISWRKTEPDPCVMRSSGRFVLSKHDGGIAMLTINNARLSDSGSYLCTVSNEIGSTQCSAMLAVSDTLPPLLEPQVEVLSCSNVLVTWEGEGELFEIEYCKLGSGEWLSPNGNRVIGGSSYMVEHLTPGETYSFRLVAEALKLVGLPSPAVSLPVADNIRWQQEQFKRRYVELEEIGKGRFAIVRRAKDRGTGQEVALKEVLRRKQSHQVTQAEYALLANFQHVNIIHAMALFDNAPVPGVDTIVLEL